MTSEIKTETPPSRQADSFVQQLCSAVQPWKSLPTAAESLVQIWGEALHLQHCVICWSDPFAGTLTSVSWHPNQQADLKADAVYDPADLASPSEFFASLNPDISLRWIPLTTGSDSGLSAAIGIFPEEAMSAINADWITLTGTLFETAACFHHQLLIEKLESLAEYAAGAGHEINNPLASIRGRASQLLKEETDPERKRLLETIGAQAYRIRDMIGDTMLFGRPPEPRFESLNLNETVSSICQRMQKQAVDRMIKLSLTADEQIRCWGDAVQLDIVMTELIRNSIEAISTEGEVRVAVQKKILSAKTFAELLVTDTGAGFTAEQRRHCLDPFYSGQQAGRGLGFGLSKCWRIIRAHHGHLQIHEKQIDKKQRETTLQVLIPCEPVQS